MSRRSDVLELAILGLLDDAPMHGYHLRKHVTALLEPWGSAVSFGTLYPALRRLLTAGFAAATGDSGASAGRRARVVYSLTERGRLHLRQALADPTPTLGDDECFGVRYAFFTLLQPEERVRVLEVRKAGLLDRLTAAQVPDACRLTMLRDPYRLAWSRRGRESVENELRWTEACLAAERAAAGALAAKLTDTTGPTEIQPAGPVGTAAVSRATPAGTPAVPRVAVARPAVEPTEHSVPTTAPRGDGPLEAGS